MSDEPELIQNIQDAAETVHSHLGPNWTETVYHSALLRELSERGIAFNSEPTIPVTYKGVSVGRRRPDLIITPEYSDSEDTRTYRGGVIVIELKAGTNSGLTQLGQYVDILLDDENYEHVNGGCLIQFNAECQFEYIQTDG